MSLVSTRNKLNQLESHHLTSQKKQQRDQEVLVKQQRTREIRERTINQMKEVR
jgi:hypothetical protein